MDANRLAMLRTTLNVGNQFHLFSDLTPSQFRTVDFLHKNKDTFDKSSYLHFVQQLTDTNIETLNKLTAEEIEILRSLRMKSLLFHESRLHRPIITPEFYRNKKANLSEEEIAVMKKVLNMK